MIPWMTTFIDKRGVVHFHASESECITFASYFRTERVLPQRIKMHDDTEGGFVGSISPNHCAVGVGNDPHPVAGWFAVVVVTPHGKTPKIMTSQEAVVVVLATVLSNAKRVLGL